MTTSWALELVPAGDTALLRVAGLSVVLRLCLDAQAVGANRIVLPASERALRAALVDRRLRLPIVNEPESNERVVRVDSHLITHREVLRQAAERRVDSDERVVTITPLAEAVSPYGFSPIAITDSKSIRDAERALFRSLRKTQDGWTSRWLNRYISLTLSRWLVHTPLRPNQISVGILAVGLLGAWLASRGDYWSLVLGATLFQSQSVLDGCDGELSRVTHRGSLLGEWLDTVGDDLTNYGFFAGAAWGLYQTTGTAAFLVAGVVVVVSGLLGSGLEYRYLWRIGSGDLLRYPLSAQTSSATGILGRIQPLFKRDTFVFVTFLAALAGWVGPMLFVFAAGAIGVLASVLATERRLRRETPTRT